MIVDQRVLAISRGIERLAQLVPVARSTLLARRVDADGFPPGQPEVAVRSSATTTSVESAASARVAAGSDLDDLDGQIETLWVLTSDALRFVRRLVEPGAELDPEPLNATLCKPRGREGAAEWAADALDCADLPVRRGLCGRHYMREYRWRRANGLPIEGEHEQT